MLLVGLRLSKGRLVIFVHADDLQAFLLLLALLLVREVRQRERSLSFFRSIGSWGLLVRRDRVGNVVIILEGSDN